MKKIGIYTIHADYNFGAMLQAYATVYFLRKSGYDVEIVNFYPESIEKSNLMYPREFSIKSYLKYFYTFFSKDMKERNSNFSSFHKLMKLSRRYSNLESFYVAPPDYDVHLVGSDQVWNIERGLPKNAFYFLDFLGENVIKGSYASSFGISIIPDIYNDRLKSLLLKFSFIGVREDVGCDIVRSVLPNKNIQHVVDPTFLLDHNEWSEMLDTRRVVSDDYILYYGFDRDPYVQEVLLHAKKLLGIKLVIVTSQISTPYKADIIVRFAGPLEFMNLIKNANLVIASSFHGVAFSINFKVPFFALKYKERNSRVESLLRVSGLSDRLVTNVDNFKSINLSQFKIDYGLIQDKLSKHIDESKSWLLSNLS